MTTLEKLHQIFEQRRDNKRAIRAGVEDKSVKAIIAAMIDENDQIENMLKQMIWTGEIEIKFKCINQ